jgi:hypothetical protein
MRKIFHRFFTIVAIVFAGLVLADKAKACSCSISPTVDIVYQYSPNVVILKLKSSQSFKTKSKKKSDYYIATMMVEKVFKGNLNVGQELVFNGEYSSCDGGFDNVEIGTELLTYLDNKEAKQKYWSYPICSRSGGVEYKKEDLSYIENIDKVGGKTRLSGKIFQSIESAIEGVEWDFKRLPSRNVRIVGNSKNIQLKTDENGFWEIYDLPVGFYSVSLVAIEGYGYLPEDDSNEISFPVEIKLARHTERNFTYTINNSISGKLFDTSGKPIKTVCLELLPTHGKKDKYFHKFDCTEKDGSFKIDTIPIGKYVIVVNEEDEVNAYSPFRKFYYPNAKNLKEAREIVIRAGDHLKDLVITAPNTTETIEVSGILLYSDGKPVVEERVEFHKNIKNTNKLKGFNFPEFSEETDESGRFNLRILKGDKGILFSEVYLSEIEDCLGSDEFAKIRQKSKKVNSDDIYTNEVIIEANKDLSGIVLKFPFPSCKKAKID